MGGIGGFDPVGDALDTVEELGHSVSSGARNALRQVLGSQNSGFGLLAKNAGLRQPGRRAPMPKDLAPHAIVPLLQAEELVNGVASSGQQYSFSGRAAVPAGTAVAAGAVLFDMFLNANVPQFSANYQLPNPFQCKTIRISMQHNPVNGAVDDASWRNALQLAWTIQTEVARTSLLAYEPECVLADGTGTSEIDTRDGVPFSAYFSGGSTNYKPQVIAPIAANPTTSALGIGWTMDGWTIQGGKTDTAAVTAAVANLLGTTPGSALAELRMHLANAGQPILF
jgi:hypothetical protein